MPGQGLGWQRGLPRAQFDLHGAGKCRTEPGGEEGRAETSRVRVSGGGRGSPGRERCCRGRDGDGRAPGLLRRTSHRLSPTCLFLGPGNSCGSHGRAAAALGCSHGAVTWNPPSGASWPGAGGWTRRIYKYYLLAAARARGGRREGGGPGGYGASAVTSRLLLAASGTVNLGCVDLRGWFC